MSIIRSTIPDKLWDALPDSAQKIITEKDFKERMRGFLKVLKPKVLKDLDAGKIIALSTASKHEAARLLKNGTIESAEHTRVKAYFTEQVGGAVAGAMDPVGLRKYLCVGDRTYVRREDAPEDAWTKYALDMCEATRKNADRIAAWAFLQQQRFGRLPAEVRAAMDFSAAPSAPTKADNDTAPKKRRGGREQPRAA